MKVFKLKLKFEYKTKKLILIDMKFYLLYDYYI